MTHKRELWANMKDLANREVGDSPGLKVEFPKWVVNDICEPITKLFILVARVGLPNLSNCQHLINLD
jgi:hypothetical protein